MQKNIKNLDFSLISMNFKIMILTCIYIAIFGNLMLFSEKNIINSLKILFASVSFMVIFFTLFNRLKCLSISFIYVIILYLSSLFLSIKIFYVIFSVILFVSIIESRKLFINNNAYYIFLIPLVVTIVVFGGGYSAVSFDMIDRVHYGFINKDTLYHISLASMIKNYGATSTGLNGLVSTPYHIFSHMLYASFSKITNVSVLEVYGYLTLILLSPLLIFSMVNLIFYIGKIQDYKIMTRSWILIGGFLSIYPFFFYKNFGGWDQYFTSESYLLALCLILNFSTLIFSNNVKNLFFLTILYSVVLSFTKGSIGIIYSFLVLVSCIKTGNNFSNRNFLIAILCFLASIISIYHFAVATNGGALQFLPFGHIQIEGFLGSYIGEFKLMIESSNKINFKILCLSLISVTSFVILNFSIVFIFIYLYRNNFNIFYNKILYYFIITLLTLSIFLLSIIYIGGGSLYYVTNPVVIFSIVGLSYIIAVRIEKAIYYVVLSCIITIISYNGIFKSSYFLPLRSEYMESNFINYLINIRENGDLAMVYSPSKNMLDENPVTQCNARPFVYPAISERPWTDVIENAEDCIYNKFGYTKYENYGYQMYGLTPQNQRVLIEPELKSYSIRNLDYHK